MAENHATQISTYYDSVNSYLVCHTLVPIVGVQLIPNHMVCALWLQQIK